MPRPPSSARGTPRGFTPRPNAANALPNGDIPPPPSRSAPTLVPPRELGRPAEPGLRTAAWQSKWQALEEDLQEAVDEQPDSLPVLSGGDAGKGNSPGGRPPSIVQKLLASQAAAAQATATVKSEEEEGFSARSLQSDDFVGQKSPGAQPSRLRGTPRGSPRLEASALTGPEERGSSQTTTRTAAPLLSPRPVVQQDETQQDGDVAKSDNISEDPSEDSKDALIKHEISTGSPEAVPSSEDHIPMPRAEHEENEQKNLGSEVPEAIVEDPNEPVSVKVDSFWDLSERVEEDVLFDDKSLDSSSDNSSKALTVSAAVALEVETVGSKAPSAKGMRAVYRLWLALVLLSIAELVLFAGASAADHFWSPCRDELSTCNHLHPEDCNGTSCRDAAPFWASAWPMASLLFLALPLRFSLTNATGELHSSKLSSCPKALPVMIVVSLAVLGAGASVLSEFSSAGLHYAARCPMPRAASRCTADICPSPPCRRESDFSPCVCGLIGEAELARAIFLNGFPACQPYEWYSWQMVNLEALVLQYESFACIAGPLTCTATAVGGILLLVQMACCPLLLIGHWGGSEAILVLLGSMDELDAALLPESKLPRSESSAALISKASSMVEPQQIPPPLPGGLGLARSAAPTRGPAVSQRKPYDGGMSPEVRM